VSFFVWCGRRAKISSSPSHSKIFLIDGVFDFFLFCVVNFFSRWSDSSHDQHKRLEKQEKSNSSFSLSLSLSLSLCSFSRRPLERAIFTESEKERQTERSHHHVFDRLLISDRVGRFLKSVILENKKKVAFFSLFNNVQRFRSATLSNAGETGAVRGYGCRKILLGASIRQRTVL